jgi:hypothetical protein
MALPTTQEQADVAAVKAYHWAAKCGSAPHPDSPIGRAAARAVERQEQLHPHADFVAKAIEPARPGDDITEHHAETVRGQQVARTATDHKPIPNTGDAVARTRASLAGVGAIDLAGAGASTIASDVQDGEFLAKLKTAEQARVVQNDPLFGEAMTKARQLAARKGRPVKAEDFNAAMAEVRAARGPQPYAPPQPVVPLLAGDASKAAKATSGISYSPIPDRIGGR